MGRNNKKINITYQGLGACQRVTGSGSIINIKVNNKETKILVDLGAIQDGHYDMRQLMEMNRLDRNMGDIGHVILTHAHL